jgi:hypothetical protein
LQVATRLVLSIFKVLTEPLFELQLPLLQS